MPNFVKDYKNTVKQNSKVHFSNFQLNDFTLGFH